MKVAKSLRERQKSWQKMYKNGQHEVLKKMQKMAKSCQNVVMFAKIYQNVPKDAQSCHMVLKVPKVSRSCQKMAKVLKRCQKLC